MNRLFALLAAASLAALPAHAQQAAEGHEQGPKPDALHASKPAESQRLVAERGAAEAPVAAKPTAGPAGADSVPVAKPADTPQAPNR
jgi:hypothetical protein